jgi:hypothetical protein
MRKLIISLAAAPAITRTALQLPISQRVTRRTYGQAPRITSYARQGRQEPALENHPDREPFRRISREGSSQGPLCGCLGRRPVQKGAATVAS